MDDHSRTCKALTILTYTLPHHLLILVGDFKANWDGPNTKDDNVRSVPYRRWIGPTAPTFVPQSRPDQSTCIDHIVVWDPRGLTTQASRTHSTDRDVIP